MASERLIQGGGKPTGLFAGALGVLLARADEQAVGVAIKHLEPLSFKPALGPEQHFLAHACNALASAGLKKRHAEVPSTP